MKREEIEQLLAEYVNEEISSEKRLILNSLFDKDPALKQEAEELLALWKKMDNTVVIENNDKEFYKMLEAAKQDNKTRLVIKLNHNKAWFYATAAAACIIMFFAGRFTAAPVEIIKYKEIIVKQMVPVPSHPQVIQTTPETPKFIAKLKPKNEVEAPSVLAQQLRSVYASERIAAIMTLSGSENIDPDNLKILEIALREDDNPNVKLTIINVLQPLARQQSVQNVLIRALNQQDDALTQTSLINVLVNAKSRQAIPQMIALLDNKNTSTMVQGKIKEEIERFAY